MVAPCAGLNHEGFDPILKLTVPFNKFFLPAGCRFASQNRQLGKVGTAAKHEFIYKAAG